MPIFLYKINILSAKPLLSNFSLHKTQKNSKKDSKYAVIHSKLQFSPPYIEGQKS